MTKNNEVIAEKPFPNSGVTRRHPSSWKMAFFAPPKICSWGGQV